MIVSVSRVKSPAAADMNRETDVEMNNTGAAKMANNSGNADGTAPTPVELQSYDAVDSVMRGIPHSKPTQFAHISSSSFLITSLLTPPPPHPTPLSLLSIPFLAVQFSWNSSTYSTFLVIIWQMNR